MSETKTQEKGTELIFDGKMCKIARHPVHGVVIQGQLEVGVVDGAAVMMPTPDREKDSPTGWAAGNTILPNPN